MMQKESKDPTTKKPRSLKALWQWWKKSIQDWQWYRKEHPDHFTLDIQGGVKKLLKRLQEIRQKMRHLSAQKKAHKFPESEYGAAQLFLFLIGSLPKAGAMLREKMMVRRKLRIRLNGRFRAVVERIRIHPAAFVAGALAVAGVALAISLYTVGVTVRYDGIGLGTVSGRRTVYHAATKLEHITQDTLEDDSYKLDRTLLETHLKLVSRKELSTEEEFESKLSDEIGLVSYGYVLYVNDEPVAATHFAGALEELLEQLKAGYATANTVECNFQESIEIKEEYIDASYMMNLGYIAELLNDTRQGEMTYTVKAGDVWSEIAEENGMTNKELLALNPGYDISNIHIGDVLTITRAVSYLTVVNVERQNYISKMPYDVEYEDDSSMYQGDYSVLSEGSYGKADVTANVTYLNGEEIDREVVASVTLVKPVTEKQARGTKERPSWFPTGDFRWPCYGDLTSYFGYRDTGISGASTYHEGIDIGNSYGTAICASDGGTVSYAGWMGGYGYLVIIDHGNGYETYYGHNSSLAVSSGDRVYQGQLIAYMGSTGVSSGDHCHFGIMKNGTFVNPLNYI